MVRLQPAGSRGGFLSAEGIARQELFTTETFEKTRSLNLSDGSTAPIANSFGKDETAQIQAFISSLPPEHTQNLQNAGQKMATEASAAVAAASIAFFIFLVFFFRSAMVVFKTISETSAPVLALWYF